MNQFRAFKYLSFLTVPFTVWICFTARGVWTFLPLLYVFGLVPLMELLLKPHEANAEKAEEELRRADRTYDWILYLALPIQYAFLGYFLYIGREPGLYTYEITGRVFGMGILCGILGINVAHELGHRSTKFEQAIAKVLLLSSLYTHFFIEHNRGHHKNVSTDEDPASARHGEILYAFWFRSVIGGYWDAWKIEAERLKRNGLSVWSFHNEMLQWQLAQILLLGLITGVFGWQTTLGFIAAATVGFLLLETVNYIEHYGLRRQTLGEQRFERVRPAHSWNSNHLVGRVMLFELSRHSDHHFVASRKYQLLRHHPDSPQMPTGYPGMMLLALVPPLWFYVMHRREPLKSQAQGEAQIA